MPCTYVIWSEKTGKFYVGSSRENSAATRLDGHNSGKAKSTRLVRPWVLKTEEFFETYKEARIRENFLKSGQGRKLVKESFV